MIKNTKMAGALLGALGAMACSAGAEAATLWTANGHYYAFIEAPDLTWQAAAAAAETAPAIEGYYSYLATVDSAAENSFIITIPNGTKRGWIGASDQGDEGHFTWRTGPEAGQAIAFQAFAGGQPNNCCGGENYVHMNYHGAGTWNDLAGPPIEPTGYNDGYFVEYSARPSQGPSPVPEPTTWSLLLLGLGAAGTVLRRREPDRRTHAA